MVKNLDNLMKCANVHENASDPNTKCEYYVGGGDGKKYCLATSQTSCARCRFASLNMNEKVRIAYKRLGDLEEIVVNHVDRLMKFTEIADEIIDEARKLKAAAIKQEEKLAIEFSNYMLVKDEGTVINDDHEFLDDELDEADIQEVEDEEAEDEE